MSRDAVLVTATVESGARLRDELLHVGMRPLLMPTIATLCHSETRCHSERSEESASPHCHSERSEESAVPDWLVFASAAAVRHTPDLRARANRARVAAVGPSTAESLRAAGITPDFVTPTFFDGASLAQLLPVRAGERVVIPRSDIALPTVAQTLTQRGASVRAPIVYRTVIAPRVLPHNALREVACVTFMSPSAVRATLAMLGAGDATALLRHTVNACIGPTTASAARAAGIRVDVVAREYTARGLARALLEHRS